MKKIIVLMIVLSMVFIITLTGCASEHMDDLHNHSVEIEGKDMKYLSVQEVADMWEINSADLLRDMILEFNLEENYTVDSILYDIKNEYSFSPALIKDLAENLKE